MCGKERGMTNEHTKTHACDCISRRKAFEYFVTLWECIGTIMDRDEWEDICMTTANEIPSAQPEIEERKEESAQNVPKEDLISRKAAIDAVNGVIADYIPTLYGRYEALPLEMAKAIKRLPTVEPTLYGYNIKHLAFVATVMEKEGVTAEYAARTFDDISRILKMVIDEAREKILAEVVKKAD